MSYAAAGAQFHRSAGMYSDPEWVPTGRRGLIVSRAASHKFLRCSINVPRKCDWCKGVLWPKQVLRCAECTFTIHRKCEAAILSCPDESRKECRGVAQRARRTRPTFCFKVRKANGDDAVLEVDPNSNSLFIFGGTQPADKLKVPCSSVLVEKPLRNPRHLELRLPDSEKATFQFATRREREEFAAAAAYLAGRVPKAGRSAHLLRVFYGTWNMGDAPPPEQTGASGGQNLADWLHPEAGYDIVAINVQECEYKPRYGFPTCEEDWFRTLESVLGTKYVRIAGQSMMSIRIVVFVRGELREQVTQIQRATEATGIARVVGNKGGVLVSFNIRETRLCFVGSHLAAHQERVEARNSDHQEIIQGTSSSIGWKDFEITNEFHYIFWGGDLNYRIDHDRLEVVRKADAGPDGWNELYQYDQLRTELRKESVFVEWYESQPFFKPTYRYLRGEDRYSEEKARIPSWCDRVLWKNLSEEPVTQEDYNSVQTVLTSDHRPVYSVFQLMMRNQYVPRSIIEQSRSVERAGPADCEPHDFEQHNNEEAYFDITRLCGHDLMPADANGLSDPYIVFQGPVLQNAYQTKVLTKTLDPVWEDDQKVGAPQLWCVFPEVEFLEEEYLWFCVYDWDLTTQDDPLGQAHLALKGVCDGQVHNFCVRILSGGKVAGTLTGCIQLRLVRGGQAAA